MIPSGFLSPLTTKATTCLVSPAQRSLAAAALLCLGLIAPAALAEVVLPNVFSDHMVLQRRQANRVWGKAAPGEKVVVTIAAQSHEATAGADGTWQVMLAPMEASAAPAKLVARGSTNEVAVDDVLVGEVWVCSGQSNMAASLNGIYDSDLEIAAANHPEIRMITFPSMGPKRVAGSELQTPNWTYPNAHWMISTPQTARSFSAVGYIFARQIHESLGVPVGIISNAWSGSRGEAWIPRKYFDGRENLLPIVARFDGFAKELAELEARGTLTPAEQSKMRPLKTDVDGDDRPANAWNGIVASHAGYGIRGVLWYQGEGNTPRGHQYRELFPLLVESWRKEWGQGDFPFYWVQLPGNEAEKPEPGESDWAELREAQTMTLKLPNTGQAITIDLGEDGNLHPKSKKDIGLRLARLALARDYGMKMPYQSPEYRSMNIAAGKAVLTFDHPNGNLRVLTNPAVVRGFAIAGEDKKFVWANATINRDGTITVSSDKVPNPVAVRYGWADNPACNVFDSARLPLTPFRTDDWPGKTVGVLVH
jgi:sialate O-acetylesterase